jgi:hypothetical protein
MKLNLYARPWALFDPALKEHRKLYANFMNTGNWSSCPVRFVEETDGGNLAGALQRKLTAYYMEQEFGVEDNRSKPLSVVGIQQPVHTG